VKAPNQTSSFDGHKVGMPVTGDRHAFLDTRPQCLQGTQAHHLLDEMVLYSSERNLAVSLNRTARAIWELCDGRRTIREISRQLEKKFKCPESSLAAEVGDSILRLRDLKLLELKGKPCQGNGCR
jgi:hypothetical protein